MEKVAPTKIDIKYANEKVVFRISSCTTDKKYSLHSLKNRTTAEKFIKAIKKKEELTWKQLASVPRERGITPEIKNSKSYKMIDDRNKSDSMVTGEKYYFHMRVTGKFRIFGYQWKEYFFITHIDVDGKIHNH